MTTLILKTQVSRWTVLKEKSIMLDIQIIGHQQFVNTNSFNYLVFTWFENDLNTGSSLQKYAADSIVS